MRIGRITVNLDACLIRLLDGVLFVMGGFLAVSICLAVLKLAVWVLQP